MEAEEAFGQTVRGLRQKKKWSQEQLAFEAGMDRNYISLIELGRNSPSVKMIFKLSGALGIRASALMALVEHRQDRQLDPSDQANQADR